MHSPARRPNDSRQSSVFFFDLLYSIILSLTDATSYGGVWNLAIVIMQKRGSAGSALTRYLKRSACANTVMPLTGRVSKSIQASGADAMPNRNAV
jgi:hypothetical protein